MFFYTDIDECLEAAADLVDICLANTQCVNTPGSFECACASGYTMMEGTCQRMSSCIINLLSSTLMYDIYLRAACLLNGIFSAYITTIYVCPCALHGRIIIIVKGIS